MDHSPSTSPSPLFSHADLPIVMYSLSDSHSSQTPSQNEDETDNNEGGTSKNEGGTSKNEGGMSKNEGGTSKNEGETSKNEGGMSKNDGLNQKEVEMIEQTSPNPKNTNKRRTRGVKIRSDSSSQEENQEKDNDQEKNSIQEKTSYQNTQEKSNSVRRLPASITNLPLEDERIRSKKDRDLNLPKNLKEVIEVSSGDFEFEPKKEGEMSILEMAMMKGLFQNPSWWRDGGYPDV